MLSSCAWSLNCPSLVTLTAKKLHPNLAIAPIWDCNNYYPNKKQSVVALFYFSDTLKQNIYYPIYDMDIFLINKENDTVLSHHHTKEVIQESGVDIKDAYHQSEFFYSNPTFTESIWIADTYKLNKSLQTFKIILNRKNDSYETPYRETVLNIYYIQNNKIHQIISSLKESQEELGINLGNNIAMDKKSYCSITVDTQHQTLGFNDLILKEDTQEIKYFKLDSKDSAYRKVSKISHIYKLKFDGNKYKVPRRCKAKLIGNS